LRFIGCLAAATAVIVRNCSSKGYLGWEGGREGGRAGGVHEWKKKRDVPHSLLGQTDPPQKRGEGGREGGRASTKYIPFQQLAEARERPVGQPVQLGIALIDLHFLVVEAIESHALSGGREGGREGGRMRETLHVPTKRHQGPRTG